VTDATPHGPPGPPSTSGGRPGLPSDAPRTDDAREALAWALDRYGDRLALSTSLGPQSLVILDLAASLGRRLRAFTLDTGLLFEQTHALRRTVEDRYDLQIEVLRPEYSLADQAALHGPGLWKRNPDHCCYLRKVAPLERHLATLDAWVTGVRRDHAPSRAATRVVEWDEQHGLVKVNPLAAWSRADVDRYVAEQGVPVNPLLADGYRSVGCHPCTSRPRTDDDDERAGRWAGFGKTECGIHSRPTPIQLASTEIPR